MHDMHHQAGRSSHPEVDHMCLLLLSPTPALLLVRSMSTTIGLLAKNGFLVWSGRLGDMRGDVASDLVSVRPNELLLGGDVCLFIPTECFRR